MKSKFTAEDIGLLEESREKRLLLLLAEGKKVGELATQFRVTPSNIRALIGKARKLIERARRVKEAVAAGKVSEIALADLLPKLYMTPLEKAEIHTVGTVKQKSEAELLKYRGFGKKALRRLEERLAGLNIRLPGTSLREEEWSPLRSSLQKAGYTEGAICLFREMLNALGHDVRICRRG